MAAPKYLDPSLTLLPNWQALLSAHTHRNIYRWTHSGMASTLAEVRVTLKGVVRRQHGHLDALRPWVHDQERPLRGVLQDVLILIDLSTTVEEASLWSWVAASIIRHQLDQRTQEIKHGR